MRPKSVLLMRMLGQSCECKQTVTGGNIPMAQMTGSSFMLTWILVIGVCSGDVMTGKGDLVNLSTCQQGEKFPHILLTFPRHGPDVKYFNAHV